MQSTTLSGSYGFPLCISGIRQHLLLSKEMGDYDLRRKGMKKMKRPKTRDEIVHSNQEVGVEGNNERVLREIIEDESIRDLVHLLQDLGKCCSACTAKAA